MLTSQQQAALDELMQLVPAELAMATPAKTIGILEGLTGMSADELKSKLHVLVSAKNGAQKQVVDWAARNPMDSAFTFLGAAAYAFFQAERQANPKVTTYVDAFYYISTCASVGYADIFAVTQTGKAIAALVMIVGPALAANALNRPSDGPGQ